MARRGEALQALIAEAGVGGERGWTYAADATEPEAAAQFIAGTLGHLGGLQAVVVAAGVNLRRRALAELAWEDWQALLRVNLDAAFAVTQAALPHLRDQGQGLLIYISSVAALGPDASGAAYKAAKHGLTGLAEALWAEERRHGIRASLIFPGLVNTPLVQHRPVAPTPQELAQALQPEDVAAACLYVASQPPRVWVPQLVLRPATL